MERMVNADINCLSPATKITHYPLPMWLLDFWEPSWDDLKFVGGDSFHPPVTKTFCGYNRLPDWSNAKFSLGSKEKWNLLSALILRFHISMNACWEIHKSSNDTNDTCKYFLHQDLSNIPANFLISSNTGKLILII